MRLDVLAHNADEARTALDAARTKLERIARRWSERQGERALNELKRAAKEFDTAQRRLEDALLAWARALRSSGTGQAFALAPSRMH